ncbi:hypothetical protein [Acetobacter sp. DsW_059]|uniref:hypothetical protein n=1 Tax=Acetobacter sp. DsW_059 TaxID=1670661 RepID=UPI0011776060|nr:hypothetical protein [Acetobacter sp. DsW_059]
MTRYRLYILTALPLLGACSHTGQPQENSRAEFLRSMSDSSPSQYATEQSSHDSKIHGSLSVGTGVGSGRSYSAGPGYRAYGQGQGHGLNQPDIMNGTDAGSVNSPYSEDH